MSENGRGLRRFSPVPFTQVRIEDEFWGPRLKVNRERTIPCVYEQCKKTGRIDAFRLDWRPGREPVPHHFWDSDVAKWVEAASYSLSTHPDGDLRRIVDEVVGLIVSAQQPDGYLNVHFTVVEPDKRWSNLRDNHELYTAGHLIEAGAAHFLATGDRRLLDAVCRFADYIASVFGAEGGKKPGYDGHEEIELALVKLWRATRQRRYLELSRYFVEQRGRQPHFFDVEARERGEDPERSRRNYVYYQAHLPVREQTEAVGHAVRAMYLYAAMADLAGELDDRSLAAACERLWESACLRKMYVTGGVGATREGEAFGPDYYLPNETAYAETCAAIGLVFFSHRMLQLDCDDRYADVMERALYNGVISGVSLDGERFFYENPLASAGAHHRQQWFGCACCPPNVARLLASLGGYVSSVGGGGVALHLYVGGELRGELPGGSPFSLHVDTRYPWEGLVKLTLDLPAPAEFPLRLRVPGWCRKHSIAVNGETLGVSERNEVGRTASVGARSRVRLTYENGYACLTRLWQPGDVVELDLHMPIERVEAHPRVQENRGRVALQRGPLVYCLEGCDHAVSVRAIALPDDAPLTARYDPHLLGGVAVIEGEGVVTEAADWEGTLYRSLGSVSSKRVPIRAVPYCVWDNREPGEMAVWLPRL